MSIFVPMQYYFDYYILVIWFEIKCDAFSFALLKSALAMMGLCDSLQNLELFSISVEKIPFKFL